MSTQTENSTPDTPAQLGYRWPAEWERHQGTWLAWPHNRQTWPGRFERIPPVFAQLVRTLARFEPVHVLAGQGAVHQQATRLVGHVPNVTLHDIPTNDAWVRDYGPMFLVNPGNGQLGCVNWRFNAWGGKYPPWDLDDAAGNRISSRLAAQQFQPALVLEGGAVDGNGQGTIMTTESCLLDPRRNRHATPADLESSLRQFACAQHILWLPGGPLAGDDTDGHVDQLARFAGARRVLVAVEEDPADENHVPLQANRQQLEAWRDGSGAQLEVIGLPLPQPIRYQGQRVPASYCNFYLVNGGVVMPEFDDPADARARAILAQVFPDRQVVGIAARDLIWGRGAVHCLTLQQPG